MLGDTEEREGDGSQLHGRPAPNRQLLLLSGQREGSVGGVDSIQKEYNKRS